MKKINNSVLNVIKELTGKQVEANSKKWPPECIGILHQPKRPTKK